MILSPAAAYGVDVLHSKSAEIMSASRLVQLNYQNIINKLRIFSALRAGVIALVSTGVLPAIESIGYVATDAIAAVFTWIGFVSVMFHNDVFDTTLIFL